MFRDPRCDFSETVEDVSVARDQLAFAIRHVCKCAETVNLQFVQIFVRIEWFWTAESRMGRWFGSILNDYKEIGLASGAVLEAVFIGMLGRTSQKEQYGRCYIDGGSKKKARDHARL
jgi:hypothetical protein